MIPIAFKTTLFVDTNAEAQQLLKIRNTVPGIVDAEIYRTGHETNAARIDLTFCAADAETATLALDGALSNIAGVHGRTKLVAA